MPPSPLILIRDSTLPSCVHPAESGMMSILYMAKHAEGGPEACRLVMPEDLAKEVQNLVINVFDAYAANM